MALRNVDTPDNAPGAGFAPMLSKQSRSVEGSNSLIQILDQWQDIEDSIYLSLPPVSITLPVLSVSIGWRPAISYKVPTGKIFIPDWLYASSGGALNFHARVARRYRLWSFAGATIAAPATPGAPSAQANQAINMPTGAVSYKLTGINNVGETTPSAASANVTTGAATSAIDFTFATPTGARRVGIYRTASGNGTAGPWGYLHEIDAAHPSPYRDVHPDVDIDFARTPPGANGTAGNTQGDIAPNPVSEVVFGVQDVALAASPTRFVYVSEDGLSEGLTANMAITLTVNSQTKVSLKRQELGGSGAFDAIAASAFNLRGCDVNSGLTKITTVLGNPATGQYNIYGYHPVLPALYAGGAIAGTGLNTRYNAFKMPVVFPAGSDVIVQLVHPQGIAAAAATYEVCLAGRLITI